MRPARASGRPASPGFRSWWPDVAPRIIRFAGEGFDLTFEARGGYLRAQVDAARDNFEISLGYWQQIARECHERGSTHVLVVENIPEAGNPLDMERLIDSVIALGFQNIKVAFVDLFDEHLQAMEHGEILARERGIVGRVFAQESDAERWLRYG